VLGLVNPRPVLVGFGPKKNENNSLLVIRQSGDDLNDKLLPSDAFVGVFFAFFARKNRVEKEHTFISPRDKRMVVRITIAEIIFILQYSADRTIRFIGDMRKVRQSESITYESMRARIPTKDNNFNLVE
jgi:hypothetical protein